MVRVGVEQCAEQFGFHCVALATVPRAEAAHGVDKFEVVVDDRLDDIFEWADEDDPGERRVVDRLRTVEGEGSCI